jgi:nucleotide-binding universal stress UspA family protein
MYARILVPLDGSKVAERALPAAEELGRLMRAPLHLVRVVDPAQISASSLGRFDDVIAGGTLSSLMNQQGDLAHGYLERMAAREIEHGLNATSEVGHGSAGREIVALTQPGDLIVMTTHGYSGVVRWFLGSVAEDVIRHSLVPVLLIRGAEDAGHGDRPA